MTKPKVVISFEADEWYPVYEVSKSDRFIDGKVELSESELADFNEVFECFEQWQTRLRLLIRGY